MTKAILTVQTPVGTFTRKTDSAYKFMTVWASPRAMAEFQRVQAGGKGSRSGVYARFAKDLGYGVTWHYSRPTPTKYGWDSEATLVGVFEVK